MKKIACKELKKGMQFSKAVFLDEENLFLPEKLALSEKDIIRLSKLNVTHVYTDGEILNYNDPALSYVYDYKNTDAYETYSTAINLIGGVFSDILKDKPVDTDIVDRMINNMLRLLIEKPEEIISLTALPGFEKKKAAKSAVNTMVLSVITAVRLKLSSVQLMHLSLAAIFHDIGMLKLPDAIKNKEGRLTDDERNLMFQHPFVTAKYLSENLSYQSSVADIALAHHERWDGKGYPRKLKGEKIPVESRILSVADAFDAMLQERPYRVSMVGYEAMKAVLSDNSRRFDPEVLRIFIKILGIYPVGSLVALNDGSIAKVIKAQKESPLRPVVKILIDKDGEHREYDQDAVVDLMKEKKIFIARAIDAREVKVG